MTKSLNCRPAFALALTMSVALWMFPETAISSAGNKKSQGKLQFLGISFNAPKKANGIGRFTMTMQKRFHCRYLRQTKVRSLRWLFDDGGDGDFDLIGKFVCKRKGLRFHLRGTRTHNRYEPIRPKRPNRRTLQVGVPLDLAEFRARRFSAVARSRDAQSPGCSEPCKDRLPPREEGFP